MRNSLKHRDEHTQLVNKTTGPLASSPMRDLAKVLCNVADFMMLA